MSRTEVGVDIQNLHTRLLDLLLAAEDYTHETTRGTLLVQTDANKTHYFEWQDVTPAWLNRKFWGMQDAFTFDPVPDERPLWSQLMGEPPLEGIDPVAITLGISTRPDTRDDILSFLTDYKPDVGITAFAKNLVGIRAVSTRTIPLGEHTKASSLVRSVINNLTAPRSVAFIPS